MLIFLYKCSRAFSSNSALNFQNFISEIKNSVGHMYSTATCTDIMPSLTKQNGPNNIVQYYNKMH